MSDPRALSGYWLRDNCPCVECRDPGNGQKLFQITDLPADLAVRESAERDGHLTVLWTDGHRSRYPLAWLAAAAPDGHGPENAGRHPGDHRTEAAKRLWRAADFAAGHPEAHWDAHLADPAERAAVLRAVRHLGFAVLRGVPTTDRQVLAVARTFGHVRVTNYGELFDVRVEPDPNNLADAIGTRR
ncbi:gamma-butyrobetaine hydroxylase-like domain-containing protein [Kitasatospora sp. NPDC093679]|uniref:gamma-butyrobetaine hydroxylase-like domain-containing protein n=1 Tax=Kitasatospora sp. NPDC093679 TaxID=3154983 RepID=UPI003436D55F